MGAGRVRGGRRIRLIHVLASRTALGLTATGEPALDAYLWIKRPGESDGECRGGPAAGQWWPEYALGPARNSAG